MGMVGRGGEGGDSGMRMREGADGRRRERMAACERWSGFGPVNLRQLAHLSEKHFF